MQRLGFYKKDECSTHYKLGKTLGRCVGGFTCCSAAVLCRSCMCARACACTRACVCCANAGSAALPSLPRSCSCPHQPLQLPAPAAAVARNVTVALLWLPHLVLCSGSFATVKAATRKADGTKWAVKIIAKQSLGPEDEEALKTEVAILQKVDHENIVALEQIFDCPKNFYMVHHRAAGCAHSAPTLTHALRR